MRRTLVTLCFLSLVIFLVYAATAPASVYHGDSGETITACYTLGIQHPPGYPVFSLIGKLFTFIPVADISYRIYLFSALLSVLVFLALFTLIGNAQTAFGMQRQSAFVNALFAASFSAGAIIWEQSVTAKGGIYMLNLLFTTVLYIIAVKSFIKPENRKIKYIYLMALIYGLSWGNHHMTQIVMLPSYVAVLFAAFGKDLLRPKLIITSFIFFVIGFSVYLYLPLRASNGAAINWGDPSNLTNFMQVFSRYQYVRAEGARSVSGSFAQIVYFLNSILRENIFTFIFFAAGCVFAFRKNPRATIIALSPVIIFLITISIYLNLTQEKMYIMQTYITPVFLSTAFLASLSFYFFRSKSVKNILTALLIIALISNCAMLWFRQDRSRYFFARDYNQNILMLADPNSIIFTTGDGVVFPAWYSKYVKKLRPDVTVIGTAVLPMKWVRDSVTAQNPGIRMPYITTDKIGTESTGYIINYIIKANMSTYPIYFSYNKPEENALTGGFTLMPKGVLFRVLPQQYAQINEAYLKTEDTAWKLINMRGVIGDYSFYNKEGSVALYIKDYAISNNAAGVFFEDNNRNDLALNYFTRAHKIQPDDHEFIYNMGNANFNLGNSDKALEMYKAATAIKPNYESALYNIGVVYYKTGRYREAYDAFLKLKQAYPNRTDLDSTLSVLSKTLPQ